jgi:hypothetical protein
MHGEELRRLLDALGPSAELLIARERAMLDNIWRTAARLASPLVQPGLFDRRIARLADAQARVVQAALTKAEKHIAALERLSRSREGERHLIFTAAIRAL